MQLKSINILNQQLHRRKILPLDLGNLGLVNKSKVRSSLYTPSNLKESIGSLKYEFPQSIDAKVEKKVRDLLNPRIEETDTYPDQFIDYDTIINNNFNVDQYKREKRKNYYIDSMHKVFINTRFDRREVKESKIPLEVLFNPKVEQIKSEERALGIKPSK